MNMQDQDNLINQILQQIFGVNHDNQLTSQTPFNRAVKHVSVTAETLCSYSVEVHRTVWRSLPHDEKCVLKATHNPKR
jgi:hypothetical protein